MATEPTFYDVLLTPEDAPHAKPTRVWLCEYHYLQACSCLMVRRVLKTWMVGHCKFCS